MTDAYPPQGARMYFGETTPPGYEYELPDTRAGAFVAAQSPCVPVAERALERLRASAREERAKETSLEARSTR